MVTEPVSLEQERRRKEEEARNAAARMTAPVNTDTTPDPTSGYNDQISSPAMNMQNMGFGQIIVLFLALLMSKLGDNSFFSGLFGKMTEDIGREKGDALYINRKPKTHYNPGESAHDFNKPVNLKDYSLTSDGWPKNIEFVKAYKQGNDVVYICKDGEELVKHRENTRSASRSWVCNNPGNIEYGKFSKEHGAIGTDGRFAIFASPEAGMKAQAALLQSENYRNLTLEAAIHRYAPKSENDTEAYISFVERTAGVSRNVRMGDLDTSKMMSVVSAMAKHEGWKPGQTLGKGLDTAPQGDVPPVAWNSNFGSNGPVVLGMPLNTHITSDMGPRNTEIAGASRNHGGDDLHAPMGTPLIAQGTAKVAYAGPSGGYGQAVILDHGQGVFTLYGHVQPNMPVKTGDTIQKGQRFALTGNEGTGGQAHLHYEILLKGADGRAYRIDPEQAVGKDLSNPNIRQELLSASARKMGVSVNGLASRAFDARVDDRTTSTLQNRPAQSPAVPAPASPPASDKVAAAEKPTAPADPVRQTSASKELGGWLAEKLPGIAHIFTGNAAPKPTEPEKPTVAVAAAEGPSATSDQKAEAKSAPASPETKSPALSAAAPEERKPAAAPALAPA